MSRAGKCKYYFAISGAVGVRVGWGWEMEEIRKAGEEGETLNEVDLKGNRETLEEE